LNGGPEIKKECEKIKNKGLLSVGNCVVTQAGNLKCKFVIHTSSPSWRLYKDKTE
jgi:O-acetyl-ADP-ribose deacetylase (regulator of RNase III)